MWDLLQYFNPSLALFGIDDVILGYIAIASIIASAGATVYAGEQQKRAADQQAKSARDLANHQTQIERNNAIAAKNDLEFQANVGERNAADERQRFDLEDLKNQEAITRAQASSLAQGTKKGLLGNSYSHVLKSDLFLQDRDAIEAAYGSAQTQYNFTKQSELDRLRGLRELETGYTRADYRIAEGESSYASLRNQGSNARIAGIAGGIAGIGQAASLGVSAGFGSGTRQTASGYPYGYQPPTPSR